MFSGPSIYNVVQLSMASITNKTKITQLVMKRVLIFMMNYLAAFKFAAKVLFHHPSVFERPPARRGNLDLDVLLLSKGDDSFRKKRKCSGMGQPLNVRGCEESPFSCSFISANLEALRTLPRVVMSSGILANSGCDRIATNSTGFRYRRFHSHIIVQRSRKDNGFLSRSQIYV